MQEIANDENIVPSQEVQLEVNSGKPNTTGSESPMIPEPELFLIVEYDTEPELNLEKAVPAQKVRHEHNSEESNKPDSESLIITEAVTEKETQTSTEKKKNEQNFNLENTVPPQKMQIGLNSENPIISESEELHQIQISTEKNCPVIIPLSPDSKQCNQNVEKEINANKSTEQKSSRGRKRKIELLQLQASDECLTEKQNQLTENVVQIEESTVQRRSTRNRNSFKENGQKFDFETPVPVQKLQLDLNTEESKKSKTHKRLNKTNDFRKQYEKVNVSRISKKGQQLILCMKPLIREFYSCTICSWRSTILEEFEKHKFDHNKIIDENVFNENVINENVINENVSNEINVIKSELFTELPLTELKENPKPQRSTITLIPISPKKQNLNVKKQNKQNDLENVDNEDDDSSYDGNYDDVREEIPYESDYGPDNQDKFAQIIDRLIENNNCIICL